jgi:uncharacterized Zn finger protein (UPF0148 family)
MGKPRRICDICDEPLADRWVHCPICGQHYGTAEEQGDEAANFLRRQPRKKAGRKA